MGKTLSVDLRSRDTSPQPDMSRIDRNLLYLDDDRLIFRRSWTGFKIYEVGAQWRGASLYLAQVKINRDPRQHPGTNDDYDQRLLIYLIETLLFRKASDFPIPDQAPMDPEAAREWQPGPGR